MSIQIPEGAQQILKIFNKSGYEAYLVGGCVRDLVMERQPHDWDICTAATPEMMIEFCKVFNLKYIETGLKHGTITIESCNEFYEVTTFRIDDEYSDGRHPDSVQFTRDVIDDLHRRDFTINAMAYNEDRSQFSGGIIDPFGGRRDTLLRIIRCVGEPAARFTEDKLRMLRALRFSSVLGFKIERETSAMIFQMCPEIRNSCSSERIREELTKMLKGQNILNVLLEYKYVIAQIIPELWPCIGFNQNNRYHQYDVYDHIAHAVSNYAGDDIAVKFALLLHDIGKPYCYTEDERGGHFHGHAAISTKLAKRVVDYLKFDNNTKAAILELIQYHDATLDPTTRVVKKMLNKIGKERFRQLLEVRMADILAHSEGTQESRIKRCNQLKEILEKVIKDEQCFTLKDLKINGFDLIGIFDLTPGPIVGDILKHVMFQVIDETIPNDKAAELESARNFLENLYRCSN